MGIPAHLHHLKAATGRVPINDGFDVYLIIKVSEMKKAVLTVFAAVLVMTCMANAAPVQWSVEDGGNGHWYDRVDIQTGLTWDQARIDAETKFHQGVQGHLMTITSQGEADLWETLYTKTPLPDAGNDRFWIGAYQPPESPEPAGNWRWITGEPWGFTNWGNLEPNNHGNEDVGHSNILSGQWNDLNRDFTFWNGGYLVEYPVPEPATLTLLTLGGLAIIRRRRS
jgi:hypothetical protein